MLEEFIKEINELREYKRLYESQKKDKAVMSNSLFELMTEKYNNTSYEQRRADYIADECRCCRFTFNCEKDLPENILQPVESDKDWLPSRRCCGDFEWS